MTSAGKIGLLLATIAVTVAIYFFGDFKGKSKVKEEAPAEETVSKFDYLLYKETLLQKLEPVKRQVLENLEQNLAKAASEEERLTVLNQLIAECEQQKLELMATMYSKDIASLKNEADLWDKTGTYFMGLFYNLKEEPAVQTFELEEARMCFVKAIELDSTNLEYQVRLGVTYMEDQAQTMQGVQMLLGVVEKDSTHVSANLYLGRFGIISGQFDKAISRLNTVLSADSNNIEAYILMADAQAGKGDKAKAIEYLEKVKALVSDPEFQANIDAYIEKIKNS